MTDVLVPFALLAFIAWRERQHAFERASFCRAGGKPPAPVASSRRRGRGKVAKVRVISAEDDAAFAEARGWEAASSGDTEEESAIEPGGGDED